MQDLQAPSWTGVWQILTRPQADAGCHEYGGEEADPVMHGCICLTQPTSGLASLP